MTRPMLSDCRFPPRRNLAINPSFETNLSSWAAVSGTVAASTAWAKWGTKSALYTCTSSLATAGELRLNGGSTTTMASGLVAGHTYTLTAWCNTPLAHTTFSTLATSRQRRVTFLWTNAGGTTTSMFGPQGTNTAGEYVIQYTFTVPPTAVGTLLGVGAAGSTTDPSFVTYIDSVLLEETAITHPYFDGSWPNAGWEGAAHASVSRTNGWAGYS